MTNEEFFRLKKLANRLGGNLTYKKGEDKVYFQYDAHGEVACKFDALSIIEVIKEYKSRHPFYTLAFEAYTAGDCFEDE